MTAPVASPVIHCQRFENLSNRTLYEIIQLRVHIFVEEQQCIYQDLDGLDLDPKTRHYWIERDNQVVSYLRILPHPTDGDPYEVKLSRVVTHPKHRGQGLSGQLLTHIVAEHREHGKGGNMIMDAQSYLVHWYQTFGFEVIPGPEYLIDNIPHTAMQLSKA